MRYIIDAVEPGQTMENSRHHDRLAIQVCIAGNCVVTGCQFDFRVQFFILIDQREAHFTRRSVFGNSRRTTEFINEPEELIMFRFGQRTKFWRQGLSEFKKFLSQLQ